MLTAKDWQFIDEMGLRFPHLRPNFEKALSVPLNKRFEWASGELFNQPRTGYILAGVPLQAVESVGEHVETAKEMCKIYVPEHIRQAAQSEIEIHDHPESIITDFNYEDDITKDEKRRLEYLAASIIFQAHPELMQRWLGFVSKESEISRIADDVEKFQTFFQTNGYEYAIPGLRTKFDEFWVNLNDKWKTKIGHQIYQDAQRERQHIHQMQENMEIEYPALAA